MIFAINRETFLAHETAKLDFHPLTFRDIGQRFENLRGYHLLPFGRGKTTAPLRASHVAAGLLSLATKEAGCAGLAAFTLRGLQPVGGLDASFARSPTVVAVIEKLLTDPKARRSLLELRLSVSEIYTNAHGRASISHLDRQNTRVAYYVGGTAASLLRASAEHHYNPHELTSTLVAETAFSRIFFESNRARIRTRGGT